MNTFICFIREATISYYEEDNMHRRAIFFLILLSFTANVYANDETSKAEATLYTFKSLSLELASKAAWGALKECRKKGYSVAVAVVDRGGNLQAYVRDQFAGPHTMKTAFRKAWTANSFRQSTSVLADLLKKGTIPNQVQHNPGALLVGGGELIQAGGETVGGIGVSGAPPGKSERDSIDGECAKAGIQAIEEELAFSE